MLSSLSFSLSLDLSPSFGAVERCVFRSFCSRSLTLLTLRSISHTTHYTATPPPPHKHRSRTPILNNQTKNNETTKNKPNRKTRCFSPLALFILFWSFPVRLFEYFFFSLVCCVFICCHFDVTPPPHHPPPTTHLTHYHHPSTTSQKLLNLHLSILPCHPPSLCISHAIQFRRSFHLSADLIPSLWAGFHRFRSVIMLCVSSSHEKRLISCFICVCFFHTFFTPATAISHQLVRLSRSLARSLSFFLSRFSDLFFPSDSIPSRPVPSAPYFHSRLTSLALSLFPYSAYSHALGCRLDNRSHSFPSLLDSFDDDCTVHNFSKPDRPFIASRSRAARQQQASSKAAASQSSSAVQQVTRSNLIINKRMKMF